MIDYLTHPKFLNYDPSILPSSQGGGDRMGTKTYRVLEALRDVYPRTQGICDAAGCKEIASKLVNTEHALPILDREMCLRRAEAGALWSVTYRNPRFEACKPYRGSLIA